MRVYIGILILILVATAQAVEVDKAVEDALQQDEDIKVIVLLKEKKGYSAAATRNIVSQVNASDELSVSREYKRLSGFAGKITRQGLVELKNNKHVEKIILDRKFHISLNTSRSVISAEEVWGRQQNNTNLTGAGVGICILDTGIDTDHEAFTGKIVNQSCFCAVSDKGAGGCCPNNATTDTSAEDDATNSHGTHVAGIAAGNASTRGVAPDAHLIIVKICDSAGDCAGSDILAGIDHCNNNAALYNISVISISISDAGQYNNQSACPTDFDNAIDTAASLGILTSVSSGNDAFTAGISYPSCAPNATSVGSTTTSDALSGFTNRGALLDVLAPGASIISATNNGGYGSLSGTSMSAPHVAGAAALLFQLAQLKHITYTNQQIEDAMKAAGVTVSTFPRIDVLAALVYLQSNLTINQSDKSVRTVHGKIDYNSTTSLVRIDECARITNNSIFINSTLCPEYNISATLTFFSLSNQVTPSILKDGAACTDCTFQSYSNGTFVFNITSFSTFTTGNNSRLEIFDDTDSGAVRFVSEKITFTANYTNISSGAAINGTCTINLPNNTSNMTFANSTYTHNQSLTTPGIISWNVTCDGSFSGFEPLTVADTVNVSDDPFPPEVFLVAPVNATSVTASNTITFVYNTTDNLTSVAQCALLINTTINLTDTSITESINQSFSQTLTNGNYTWGINCTDAANNTGSSLAFDIEINVGNTAPKALTIANQTWNEDTNITINLTAFFNDTEGNPLTFAATQTANITINISNGIATLSPAADFFGNESVIFTATDSVGATNSSNNISLTVTNVNDAPVFSGTISDQTFAKDSEIPNVFDLDTYFSDIDSTLTYSVFGNSDITVQISSGNSVSFSASVVTSENIFFRASDGNLTADSNSMTVTTIEPDSSSSGGGGGGGGGGFITACTDECATAGIVACASETTFLACGSYDSDTCLDLRTLPCLNNQTCVNAECVSCIEQWECGSWSNCVNGSQTRECTDHNICGTETGKPVVTQMCEVLTEQVDLEFTLGLNETVNAAVNATICGDGICGNELCWQDCKEKYIGIPLMTIAFAIVILGGLIGFRYVKLRSTK